MLVFVDESGDSGRKFGKGSTELLTVILAIFPDEEVARELDVRIDAVRSELGRGANFEFHFKDCSDSIRGAFFRAISPYAFHYTGIVIDKERWYAVGPEEPAAFYKSICGWVFEQAKPHLVEANVKIDRSGSQRFCRELASYLKRNTNDATAAVRYIKQVSMLDSKSDNLMQVADMVCGAVGRSYRLDRPEPHRFRKIIAHRETVVRYWPDQPE